MVEALALLAAGHVPSGWSVAVAAIETFSDRAVSSGSRCGLAPIRILGKRDAYGPRKT
jgi:hypothetical protein